MLLNNGMALSPGALKNEHHLHWNTSKMFSDRVDGVRPLLASVPTNLSPKMIRRNCPEVALPLPGGLL